MVHQYMTKLVHGPHKIPLAPLSYILNVQSLNLGNLISKGLYVIIKMAYSTNKVLKNIFFSQNICLILVYF